MHQQRTLAVPPALDSRDISLFLDFDGTLVGLAERPDGVVVDPGLAVLLHRLAGRLGGRLALISGRSIAQLDALIGPAAAALVVVGSHGAESRRPGVPAVPVPRPAALDAVEAAFRRAFAGNAAIVVEAKSLGVALHYRGDPAAEAAAEALAGQLAATHGLHVQKGKMVVELRVAGADKGSAIAALMAGPPFIGHRPVFLGDDVTDEAGFARCVALGGAGILVGPARPTAATARLADVAAVRAWLAAL